MKRSKSDWFRFCVLNYENTGYILLEAIIKKPTPANLYYLLEQGSDGVEKIDQRAAGDNVAMHRSAAETLNTPD